MSKADQLGTGASFGRASTARSSRRGSIDHTLNGASETSSITDLPVTLISDNPDNPRNHLRSLDETTESVREVGIILPIVVATADAYLKDRPDRASDLDDGAQYVVVDGHRRLEAARRVGLATIPVRVDNARVSTDEALLEAAFIANYHRDDMTDLEEAHALQQLVEYYGSQTKTSKRLGIPQSTLSSKMSLLKLAPELQKGLMTGQRSVEHVRNLGKLPPEKQKEKADERALAARRKPQTREKPEGTPQPAPTPNYHAVIIPSEGTGEALDTAWTIPPGAAHQSGPPALRPDAEAQPRSSETVPTTNTEVAQPDPPKRLMPYDDPVFVVMNLDAKMTDRHFADATRLMVDKHWDKTGLEPSFDLLRRMLEIAGTRNADMLLALLKEQLETYPEDLRQP